MYNVRSPFCPGGIQYGLRVFPTLLVAVLASVFFVKAEIQIDGDLSDWTSGGPNGIAVDDPADLPDTSGDIRSVGAKVVGNDLVLTMSVEGVFGPSVDETPADKTNRYYYHWLLDLDNDPATGFSSAEYEGSPTNVATPLGAETTVQFGWRDGVTDGVYAYNALDDDETYFEDYHYCKSGDSITATIPLSDLGLSAGQTIAVSAFQEGASDGWMTDWTDAATITIEPSPSVDVADAADLPDISGDIRNIQATVDGEDLVLSMSVEGVLGPSVEETPADKTNRYYYHWLIDTDNDPATGFSSAEYEGSPTNVATPLGAEITVQFGWRDGDTDGVYGYNALDDDEEYFRDYEYCKNGSRIIARIPLGDLGLSAGQTIAVSAFQEGASDGWMTDWTDAAVLTVPTGGGGGSVPVVAIDDATDLPDTSGDVRSVGAKVVGNDLVLTMSVEGVFGPSVDETPPDKTNRYYYHWLLDLDNDPATGFSSAEYEGSPTNVATPLGAETTVQFGWRDGATNGVYAYNALDDDETYFEDYHYCKSGDSITATIPLSDLGLSAGQTIAVSAFQEGASDGWMTDWTDAATITIEPSPSVDVADAADLPDISGDIRNIQATVDGEDLVLSMSVEGVLGPSVEETPADKTNRYYYHWLIDTDNDPATGFSSAEYEGSPTNVATPLGAEITVQFGWRDGDTDGVYGYNALDDDEEYFRDYEYCKNGSRIIARIPLGDLGLSAGQTIAVSAFQEGASDGWMTDWTDAESLTISAPGGGSGASIASVDDPGGDLPDTSGDLTNVSVTADDTYVYFGMSVQGILGPSVDETPAEKTNRYYYHWLLDTDNDPGTGFSSAEYEGNPTNVDTPLGAEITVQFGWRNGATDGVYAYDALTEEDIIRDYEWRKQGSTIEARIALSDLGLSIGQTIRVSAFQEGASDDWMTDWTNSAEITLAPPSSDVDLIRTFSADAYGYTIVFEDTADDVLDDVSLSVDGKAISQVTESKEGAVTTVRAVNDSWLDVGTHQLLVSYSLESGASTSRQIPFEVTPYSVAPPTFLRSSVDEANRGFQIVQTQISDAQGDGESYHDNSGDLAEIQLSGLALSSDGSAFFNEASDESNGWKAESMDYNGLVNWSEAAPNPTGRFNGDGGFEDTMIPGIPGSENSTNGIVTEIVAYLDLEPGLHRLAVNTTGGFKCTLGTDGLDRLSPLVAEFNGSRGFSSFGDHFFSILVEEPGYYPVRLLWFHSRPRNEGAQLEFYSVINKQRVLINDDHGIKAYRADPLPIPFVSGISPAPDSHLVGPNDGIEIVLSEEHANIAAGSISLSFDGQTVTPDIRREGAATIVTYDPGYLPYGSTHDVSLSYSSDADPPVVREQTYGFGVYDEATILSPAWATPPDSAGPAGLGLRVVQSAAARSNSVEGAEQQLAGGGDFSKEGTIDLVNLGTGEFGLFIDDFVLQDEDFTSGGTDNFSAEIITYLYLEPGAHTLGVNSDDGFQVTAGQSEDDQSVVLDFYNGGRGTSSSAPQNLFDVIVLEEGLYSFRMIWYQGGGDASCEWYSYDRETGIATLINDTANGGIPAYQSRTADPGDRSGPHIAVATSHVWRELSVSSPPVESRIAVLNSGGAALNVSSATLGGPAASAYEILSSPDTIAPDDIGLITVRFDSGGRAGSFVADITINSDDADASDQERTVSLLANVVDPLGPVAHYPLDETAAAEGLNDVSGRGAHGGYENGDGAVSFSEAAIASGSAVGFSGGGYGIVPGNSFDVWRSFSVSAWLNPSSVAGTQTIFARSVSNSPSPVFALLLADGALSWFTGQEAEFSTDGVVLVADTDHHVCVSYDESLAVVYVDGVEVARKVDPVSLTIGSLANFYVGSLESVLPFGGTVDDVQAYDRALTPAEVRFLNANPGVPVSSGTDPGTDDAGVGISSITRSPDGVTLSFPDAAAVEGTIDVQYSADLGSGSWETIATNVNAATYQDTDNTRTSRDSGFYRLGITKP